MIGALVKLARNRTARRAAVAAATTLIPVAVEAVDEQRNRRAAIAHARTVVDGRYSREFIDQRSHWVAWSGVRPVAAYPPHAGDLDAALSHSRRELKDPDEDRPFHERAREVLGAIPDRLGQRLSDRYRT